MMGGVHVYPAEQPRPPRFFYGTETPALVITAILCVHASSSSEKYSSRDIPADFEVILDNKNRDIIPVRNDQRPFHTGF